MLTFAFEGLLEEVFVGLVIGWVFVLSSVTLFFGFGIFDELGVNWFVFGSETDETIPNPSLTLSIATIYSLSFSLKNASAHLDKPFSTALLFSILFPKSL